MDPVRLELVWRPRIRVSGSGAFLADPAHARPHLLGPDAVFGATRPLADGTQGQHAMAVFVFRSGDTCVLCGRSTSPTGWSLHDYRFLAFLGGASVGGGFPGTVHHHHGGLYFRTAGSGCGTSSSDRDLSRHSAVFRGGS